MNFYYINPPDSGLGDRLLDIFTMYAYSKFLKCDKLYVFWKYESCFDETRQNLKLKNLLYFLQLPEDIIFVENRIVIDYNDKNNIYFTDILSAISLELFIEKYISKNPEVFMDIYFDSFKKIKFSNIPTEVMNIFNDNFIVTIHLRRTDKISINEYAHGVNNQELEKLDTITQKFIDGQIEINNINICIISDDVVVKNKYAEYNKNKCNLILFYYNDNVLQSYVDFFCLVNAKKIFMSQKFSTFSIVGSLIRNAELYYYFDYGRLYSFNNISYNFYKYKNMRLFT